jgi:hypothetical protein
MSEAHGTKVHNSCLQKKVQKIHFLCTKKIINNKSSYPPQKNTHASWICVISTSSLCNIHITLLPRAALNPPFPPLPGDRFPLDPASKSFNTTFASDKQDSEPVASDKSPSKITTHPPPGV